MAASNQRITYSFVAETKDALKNINSFASAINRMSNDVSKQTSKITSGFSGITKSLKGLASAVVGIKLGSSLASATKSTIDYVETLNLFTVAMKDSIDTTTDFVDSVSDMYGLDPKWLMDATGLFYEMAYAVDMPDKAARTLSTSLTALSVDLASLFNVDVETVSDNLTSGMRGMSRAVLKYGMDLRATTVEQTALSLGITENYETMNEASREILRYITAVRQARDATGDFAKTIESPANQLRILKEQIAQLGRAIGSVILNVLAPILPVINGIVMAIRTLIEVFSALFGLSYTAPEISMGSSSDYEDTANGIGSIGDAADSTSKKLKKLVAPFDELNILQEDQADSSGAAAGIGAGSWGEVDPRLLEALEASKYTLEEVRLKAQDTKEAILAFFGVTPDGDSWIYTPNVFKENLQKMLPQWTQTIEAMFNTDWGNVTSQLGNILSTLKEIVALSFEQLWADFAAIFGMTPDEALATFITNLPSNLASINDWLQQNKETIATIVARVAEFMLVVSGLKALASIFSPVISVFTTVGGAILGALGHLATFIGDLGGLKTIFGAVGTAAKALFANPITLAIAAVVTAVAAGFVSLYQKSEEFRTTISILVGNLGELFGSLIELFGSIVTAIGKLLTGIVTLAQKAFGALGDFVSEHFGWLLETIVQIVNDIIIAVTGIIEFLTGVFSLDLEQALNGLAKIVAAVFHAIASVVVGVINALIGALESGINFIGKMIHKFVMGIVDTANFFLSLVGADPITGPSLESFQVSIPRVPMPTLDIALATGGVVSSPTRALIGEGRYDEAVVPLEDSPQLEDMLSRFASKVEQTAGATEVRVFIGDKEWDAFTYKSAKRGERIVGSTPVKEGSYA